MTTDTLAIPSRIGDAMLAAGLVNRDQLALAIQKQQVTGERLGELMLRLGIVSEFDLARLLADQSGIPFVDIETQTAPHADILRLFNQQFCLSRAFLPLHQDGDTLVVAIGNTDLAEVEQAVNRQTGLRCRVIQCEFSKLLQSVRQYYYFADHPVEELLQREATRLEKDRDHVLLPDKLLDHLLHLAVKRRVTDIHIQPEQRSIHISFRIDGVLRPIIALSSSLKRLIAAIKMQSSMDISDNLRPQDGSFSVTILDMPFDIRVSTLITEEGENVVMRLLPSGMHVKGLNELGFYSDDLRLINRLFANPHGILLMTGPTGSGKSTTLHAGLRANGMEGKNILTVEDPIEYKLPVIRQTQVNRKAGYEFDTAIKHFLRHDPDVMLVGEIRDAETAHAAVTAAETGHLVLSTLHVNNVLGVIPRLLALNIAPQMIADSLIGVVNQRLARKICSVCKTAYTPSAAEAEYFGANVPEVLYQGSGCEHCMQTGYFGRVPIYEVIPISESLAEMIASGASRATLARTLEEQGFKRIEHLARARVRDGETSFEEIRRLLGNGLETLR